MIMKYYLETKILENINLLQYFNEKDIKKSKNKLQITNKGIYSISKPSDAKWILEKIRSNIGIDKIKTLTITDATSGIGGNVINFAEHFKLVNAVELNNTHYEVLVNNIKVLQLNNVNTYEGNILSYINTLEEDIVFIDPPWGGKYYKKIKYFNIKLGKVPINIIINRYFDKGTKYLVLKAPYNINITLLCRYVKYDNMHLYKNNNMWLLIFTNI